MTPDSAGDTGSRRSAIVAAMPPRDVAIIGAELDLGAGRRGVDMGPSAIRYAGLGDRISAIGVAVRDLGNVDAALPETVAAGSERARFLAEIKGDLRADRRTRSARRPTTGSSRSCSAAITRSRSGRSEGWPQRSGPGAALWFDAHGDLNTPETTPSGNVHGMPLAAVLGQATDGFESDAWPLPALDPARVSLIGVRSLDEGERRVVRELGLAVYTMSEIDRRGVEDVVREALARADGAPFVHVSLDMDVVDPDVAPGRGHADPRRSLLPRGAPRDGARLRVGPPQLARDRRGEPDPGSDERDRGARRRARRERARRAHPLTLQLGAARPTLAGPEAHYAHAPPRVVEDHPGLWGPPTTR